MGGKRQQDIIEMFSHPCMAAHFDPPVFSPGIPQRELRSQRNLLMHAGRAGIIPPVEWEALWNYYNHGGGNGGSSSSTSGDDDDNHNHDNHDNHYNLEEILKNVPIDSENRMGSEFDKSMHYSKELWQKAKGINRGRSVLACALAHLVAMKKLVEEDYDFILEDNVRSILGNWNDSNSTINNSIITNGEGSENEKGRSCECAERIWETIEASKDWENVHHKQCHLRYYGWLGSRTNLEFVIKVHIPKTKHSFRRRRHQSGHDDDEYDDIQQQQHSMPGIFPFPIQADIDEYLLLNHHQQQHHDQEQDNLQQNDTSDNHKKHNKKNNTPGGTPIWGAYSYWISKQGYQALIHSLQKDVGALLWKGKRMRCYHVKPIDKIIPRRIMDALDGDADVIMGSRDHIHVATHAAFFRAPMLTSQIHSQWDAEFCKSSEYQMMIMRSNSNSSSNDNTGDDDDDDDDDEDGGHVWDCLWLNQEEKCVVEYRKITKEWIRYKDSILERTSTT
jgi:hypothetical protein